MVNLSHIIVVISLADCIAYYSTWLVKAMIVVNDYLRG